MVVVSVIGVIGVVVVGVLVNRGDSVVVRGCVFDAAEDDDDDDEEEDAQPHQTGHQCTQQRLLEVGSEELESVHPIDIEFVVEVPGGKTVWIIGDGGGVEDGLEDIKGVEVGVVGGGVGALAEGKRGFVNPLLQDLSRHTSIVDSKVWLCPRHTRISKQLRVDEQSAPPPAMASGRHHVSGTEGGAFCIEARLV